MKDLKAGEKPGSEIQDEILYDNEIDSIEAPII